MTTIDNIMALHDEAAEKRHINGAHVYNAVAAHAREELRTALTEALAQPNHSEQHLDMVEGNVQVSADLIRQAATELRQQCGGRCNAEYNPCWSLELADKLQCAVKQPNISEYLEKDISAQPVREPSCDTCKHCTVADQDSFEETCFVCCHYYDSKFEVKTCPAQIAPV